MIGAGGLNNQREDLGVMMVLEVVLVLPAQVLGLFNQ